MAPPSSMRPWWPHGWIALGEWRATCRNSDRCAPRIQGDGRDVLALEVAELALDVGLEVPTAWLGLNAGCERTYERVQLLPQRLQTPCIHVILSGALRPASGSPGEYNRRNLRNL